MTLLCQARQKEFLRRETALSRLLDCRVKPGKDDVGDGMRLAAVVLFISAAIGSADVQAANPYDVFRLEMSEVEIEAAAEAQGGRILTPEELELDDSGEPNGFRIVFVEIPMEPHQATGMFVLERDRLQQIGFDYFVRRDRTPPGTCNSILEQAAKEIGEVYGAPSNSDAFAGTESVFRGKTVNWNTDDYTVSLFIVDAPPLSSPESCDIVQVEIFAGTQMEYEAFAERLRRAIAKTSR
jgi:hypothetical protein